jgi:hypothetical protein
VALQHSDGLYFRRYAAVASVSPGKHSFMYLEDRDTDEGNNLDIHQIQRSELKNSIVSYRFDVITRTE